MKGTGRDGWREGLEVTGAVAGEDIQREVVKCSGTSEIVKEKGGRGNDLEIGRCGSQPLACLIKK